MRLPAPRTVSALLRKTSQTLTQRDATSPMRIRSGNAMADIRNRYGSPSVLIHNAVGPADAYTSATRGKANFAGFAPTKAAQRILSESMARDLGPRGIHVAYVLIDAVIDVLRMRERLRDAPDDLFIKPSAIADELWHLSRQDRSAWSLLAELRPFGEQR